MKFLGLFVVALLALNVAAFKYDNVQGSNHHGDIAYQNMQQLKNFFPEQFVKFFESFMTAIREAFPAGYEYFFQNFVEVFHKFGNFFPAEFKTAFFNMFATLPSFAELYPPEFFEAFAAFFRAFEKFLMPHQFFTFVDNAFKAFPTVNDVVPAEFFANFGKFLSYVPFAKEFLKQAVTVLEYLVAGRQA